MGKVAHCLVGVALLAMQGCGQEGPAGPQGPQGEKGDKGDNGIEGSKGNDGTNGEAGVGPSGPEITSDSRIKARYVTTTYSRAAGAKQVTKYFSGWFDTQRDEACTVAVAADGKTRCLPAGAPDYSHNLFSDSGCRQPAVMWTNSQTACGATPASTPPKYATDILSAGTCTATRIRLLGPDVWTTSYYARSPSSTACQGPYAIPANTKLFPILDEVPADAFAEFTVTTEVN